MRKSTFALALTLLVAFVWLGLQLHWIRERHEAITWMQDQANYWSDMPVSQRVYFSEHAPWRIAMFGEAGVQQACVVVADKKTASEKQAELDGLFPEADIIVVAPGPGYTGKRAIN